MSVLGVVHIGIDPGLTGAVAVLHPDRTVEFFDTPTLQVKSGKKTKNIIDTFALVTILQGISANRDVMVTIEKVNAMPGFDSHGNRQTIGATSAFNFGMGFGIWVGVLAALRLPTQQVHPVRWKKSVMADAPKEKDASRVVAMRLYPSAAERLSRKKDHGRADALLMAEYARRTYVAGAVEALEADMVEGSLF